MSTIVKFFTGLVNGSPVRCREERQAARFNRDWDRARSQAYSES